MTATRIRLTIEGVVQGVGFRPHVHRLAVARSLTGHVGNDSTSVFVEVEGSAADVSWFRERLVADAPPLARVESVTCEVLSPTGSTGFEIVASRTADGARTFVPPDVAVCDDCLAELDDPSDHRHRYPFITCTNCGPRFTIIRRLPYDRSATTMAGFHLCDVCAGQYHDPTDRRFHAQPLACAACGPHLAYEIGRAGRSGDEVTGGGVAGGAGTGTDDEVIARVQHDLAEGAVVAIKGLGGYHLACDARRDDVVARLRERKGRVDKPFAVMVRDLEAACGVGVVDDTEAALLTSPARPIVLVRARPDVLSPLVAPRNPRLGVLLPYTPLHHLLFRPVPGSSAPVPTALVMTSGNLSDEPLAFDDADARRRLAPLADSFCTHDRPINVPCDDSVVRVVDGREMPIRRSRGYTPLPIRLREPVGPSLAVGGELKNTFCLAEGTHAWMSQHLGDMQNLETLAAFERSVGQFTEMYGIGPVRVATDAHPDHLARRWAEDATDAVHPVQHHHAHVVALTTEAGLSGDEAVIGVAFDGTGYGLDGAIWGGEVLLADHVTAERVAHLDEVPLPGGDAAIRNPYRTALAHLWAAGREWSDDLAPVGRCGDDERAALASMLATGTGCVPTTSMGRLFDAVSSILGVRHEITYEGQAAMELEHVASGAEVAGGPLRFAVDGSRIVAAGLIGELVDRLGDGEPVPSLAAAFHEAVAVVVADVARAVREAHGVSVVGLTGGVFQNALLVTTTRRLLEDDGFRVLTHRLVPPNDGGLALGQLVIAAHL